MRDLQKEIRKEIWTERIQAANEVKELLGSDRIEVSEPENIETTLENSPAGESQSNWLVERAVQSVQEQIRVIKDTLEHEADMTIGPQHKLWPWLTEYAAHTLLASNMGQDGKTALERYRGHQSHQAIVSIGEQVLYRPAKTVKTFKDEMRWEPATWLGVNVETREHIVGTAKGVVKCRAIAAVEEERRMLTLKRYSSSKDCHGNRCQTRSRTEFQRTSKKARMMTKKLKKERKRSLRSKWRKLMKKMRMFRRSPK